MKKRASALFFLCLFLSGCTDYRNDHRIFTNQDSWYTGSAKAPPDMAEIYKQLILPVPKQSKKTAIAALESVSVVPLSLQQAEKLLAVDKLEPDALLEKAALEADDDANKHAKYLRESRGKDKFEKKELREARRTAGKARSLKGKIKPYLVRGLTLQENPEGGFSGCQKGSSVAIVYGCLGNGPLPMKRWPVVVFLEKEPKTVYTELSMAE